MKNIIFLAVIAFSAFIVVFAEGDNEFNVVSRSEWNAKVPRQTPKSLDQVPTPYVVIGHEGGGALACHNKPKCIHHVKNMQDMHREQLGSNDIFYNFLVGGDGNVYEGRGWNAAGGYAEGYNGKSMGIAFLGDFSYREPTAEQLETAKKLIEYGVEQKKISENYKLLGEKQVNTASKSPGVKLYNIIKTWEHWSEKP